MRSRLRWMHHAEIDRPVATWFRDGVARCQYTLIPLNVQPSPQGVRDGIRCAIYAKEDKWPLPSRRISCCRRPSRARGRRPRWFDVSMWAKSLDTCMLDIRFREKFQDALAVVISDEERAGLDILTHGDFHCDEDFGGRSWHHYPLQRWTGFEGDYLQSEETRSEWLRYPPGHVAQRDLHRLALAARDRQDRASPARLRQDLASRAEQVAEARALRHLLLAGDGPLPRHPYRQVQGLRARSSGTWPWR